MSAWNHGHERWVAAHVMAYPDLLATYSDLEEDDFANEMCRRCFRAVTDLTERRAPRDFISILSEIGRGGWVEGAIEPFVIEELHGEAYSASGAGMDHYVRSLRMLGARRRLGAMMLQLAGEAMGPPDTLEAGEEWVSLLASRISSFATNQIAAGDGLRSLAQVGQDAITELRESRERGVTPGVPHGLRTLAAILPDLAPTDLITLAGRPGMGKSALLGQFAMSVAEAGHVVAIFSLEMSDVQLLWRMVSAPTGIPMNRLRKGDVHTGEESMVVQELSRLSDLDIWIDDTPRLSVMKIRARVDELARRMEVEGRKIGLVAVDYLQLMSANARLERHQQIGEITGELKALAKDYKVPVIQLAQLNRKVEDRSDKHPLMSDLKESGRIEEDSDVILFPFRQAYYETPVNEATEVAEIIVAKHRNGPTGTAMVEWDKKSMRFVDPVGF
jgi:replicative DNA helicase